MSLKDNFKNMFAFFQDKFGNTSELGQNNPQSFDHLIESDEDFDSWSSYETKA